MSESKNNAGAVGAVGGDLAAVSQLEHNDFSLSSAVTDIRPLLGAS